MVNNAQLDLAFPIRNISKWELADVDPCPHLTPKFVTLVIVLYSKQAGVETAWPAPFALTVRDSGASRVLQVNQTPTCFNDQIVLNDVQLSGTPYTAIFDAYHANTIEGGKEQHHRKAVEDLLPSLGVMPTRLAQQT